MSDVEAIAGQVAAVDEAIMKVLPFIATMIGFVPGARPIVPFLPLVGEILTAVDNAARSIQAGNNDAAFEDVLKEIRNHLTPGFPNSSFLSSPPEAT